MEHDALIAIALVFMGFCLLSGRLSTAIVTPPMLFVIAGFALSAPVSGLVNFRLQEHLLKLLLEATLVLVLFSDAARIDLQKLRLDYVIPKRLLLVGMGLSMLLGGVAAHFLPLGLSLWEAALVAAILTPTDAALGQAVVSSKQVPERIRLGLNVESGLNDGIVLPVVLVLASIASAMAGSNRYEWFQFAALQLFFGPLCGILVGFAGGWLIDQARQRHWISASGEGIIGLCIAGLCFITAEALHGNGFIAAFVGGLVFGHRQKNRCHYLFEFAETEGQVFTLSTFLVFGGLLLPMALFAFNPWHWLFAIFSLTVMRMLPVYVALQGLRLNLPTIAFLGWFGPRGLASILFVLLVAHEVQLPHTDTVVNIVFITVLLSVFVHGLSAAPLAARYGASRYALTDRPSGPVGTTKHEE